MYHKQETIERMDKIKAFIDGHRTPVFTTWVVLKALYPERMELDTHHPYYRVTMYALNAMVKRWDLQKITTHNNDTVWYVPQRCLSKAEHDRLYKLDNIPF